MSETGVLSAAAKKMAAVRSIENVDLDIMAPAVLAEAVKKGI
jgi:hypothetical protein